MNQKLFYEDYTSLWSSTWNGGFPRNRLTVNEKGGNAATPGCPYNATGTTYDGTAWGNRALGSSLVMAADIKWPDRWLVDSSQSSAAPMTYYAMSPVISLVGKEPSTGLLFVVR